MRKIAVSLLLVLTYSLLLAQNVQVNVDLQSNRKPVSPFIYGRNGSISDDPSNPTSPATWQLYKDAGLNFYRENGGNNLSTYNWRLKLASHPDWYNNVYKHDWDFAAASLQQNIPSAQGMWGFQLLGQAALTTANNFNDWAYNQSQYWSGLGQNLAGGGTLNPAGGSQALVNGDTSLYLEHWNEDSTTGILNHWFGSGGQGLDSTHLRYWNMDNEVEIWSGTHDDVMPVQLDAESFMQRFFAVAKKARALCPGIKLSGPVSPNEWQWYAFGAGPVTGSDGFRYPWLQYFIKRLAEEQQRTGIRLLDVIDLHFYPGSTNPADIVQYHRVFFDSSYAYPEANGVHLVNGGWDNSIQIEDVFGRCQNWLNQYMGPGNGVTFGVSETAVNLNNNPNAQAVWYGSTLGEFMKHGVEYFSPWNWEKGMWETLHLYSRYNKKTSIQALSNDELNVSAYATASDANDSITVVLVNRSLTLSKTVTVNLAHFTLPNQPVQVLTLSNLPAGTETFISHTNNALQSSTIMPASDTSVQVTLAPLSISSLQLTGSLPVLAVGLTSLTAVKEGNDVRLDFTVSDDPGVISFYIERSADGVTFNPIGTVAATATIPGNAGLERNYSYYDRRPLPSVDYYRLKIVDRSGSYTYSRTIAVAFDNATGITVFPNPANDVLYVQLPAQQGPIELELHDGAGKLVRAIRLPSAGGVISTSIDISDLASGVYYLSAGGKTLPIVKQ
ncbi:glycoside hydrolase family 44 protein [Flavitalea sp. BT771]|uniref:glycoside hydrolase family 44 protein n=1 Tax=Flavitalea sp. BT771 TaxID=3063329 RepID=UPI0026E14560|nr:glycoside hydrolase family 44 protein [Flavitalea sp. BT771]MDO6432693.1 glycoside hydrolase family 44 protein [Flavitalea sp. BT771]MDV6222031.1 glycoside hydrolase family 44 protein [Flavitalea sp. BT771]